MTASRAYGLHMDRPVLSTVLYQFNFTVIIIKKSLCDAEQETLVLIGDWKWWWIMRNVKMLMLECT